MIAGGGGSIIFIASQLGRVGSAGRAAYCATKGALIQLAKVMAIDHAGQNIRVNTLSPGAVETQRMLHRYGSFEAAGKSSARSTCRAGSAARRRSPRPRFFSPATRRALSPAAICSSTAAIPRSDEDRLDGSDGAARLKPAIMPRRCRARHRQGRDKQRAAGRHARRRHRPIRRTRARRRRAVRGRTPDDASETLERGLQLEDIVTPPPEGVALRGKRARRVERGMDKQTARPPR